MGRGGGRRGRRGRRSSPVNHPGRHLGALRAGRAVQPVVPGAAARRRAPPCCAEVSLASAPGLALLVRLLSHCVPTHHILYSVT